MGRSTTGRLNMRAETVRYAKVIKDAGIKLE